MNELKPKKKAEAQKLEKQFQTSLTKAIKTITDKLVIDKDTMTKKIEKWSKKLAKKVVKEVKANQPVTAEIEPAGKAAEKAKPVIKEQPTAKIAPSVKKKNVAATVK